MKDIFDYVKLEPMAEIEKRLDEDHKKACEKAGKNCKTCDAICHLKEVE